MTDNSSEFNDDSKSKESYSREDIESSRAVLADSKIEKLITVSPRAARSEKLDDSGNSTIVSELTVFVPHEHSVLRAYGYSRVVLGRVTRHDSTGNDVYEHPWLTLVSTYDDEGISKEDFFIFKLSESKMGIFMGSEDAGEIPIGIDTETDKVTTDIDAFDPTQSDTMIPAELRRLVGNEYANLISIITAAEMDDR